MTNLTHSEFRKMLATESTVLDVEITLVSPLTLLKKDNPYSNINFFKSVTMVGQIGRSYRKEKQASQTEEYIPHERAWGKLINPYIVEHKNNYYLQIFVDTSTEPIYLQQKDTKLEQMDVESIQDWLPASRSNKTSENDLIIRDLKFDNIKTITLKNQEYNLIPDVTSEVVE